MNYHCGGAAAAARSVPSLSCHVIIIVGLHSAPRRWQALAMLLAPCRLSGAAKHTYWQLRRVECLVLVLGSSSPAWGRRVRVVYRVHARHGVIAQRVTRSQQVASVAVERTVRRCVRQQRQYGAAHALQSPCGAPSALQDVQTYLASLPWARREFTWTVRGLVCASSGDTPSSVCLGGKSGGQET